ncbi:heme exporter permease component [Klebsiella pneumoniae subsp. rhinoscleromatis]|nr:heme exporter permease component [Klebsiella pneumoniae subsp. rhinoscleromatis]
MMRALLARELRLAWRSGAEILNPLWFFLIVITLFPFGVGAAPQLLAQIAPGVVWVVALLAALLVMDRLFRDDWQDGSLEQLMLLPTPLVAVVLVKVVAHWMMSGLPLLIVSPLAVPLLIFATAACQAAAAGLPVSGYLAMLAAFLTASATLCPFATAAALRLTVR